MFKTISENEVKAEIVEKNPSLLQIYFMLKM